MNDITLSGKFCLHNKVAVLNETEDCIEIGMCNYDEKLKNLIEKTYTGKYVHHKAMKFTAVSGEVWERTLANMFSRHLSTNHEQKKENEADKKSDEAPIINLLNSLIIECHCRKGSDIHIEYCGENAAVRFRIQGNMADHMRVSAETGDALIQRIKLLSKLEITERRRCQDGRFNFSYLHHNIDIRVSCIPSFFGESVVLRLLDRKSFLLTVAELGFSPEQLIDLDKIKREKNGLVLICGQTGSGKTTTMASLVNEIGKTDKKIISIEDPVEYLVNGVVQVPVNEHIDTGFGEVLKRAYRQDPDILLIGEIRDEQTAQSAVRCAMTGHLVFATMHSCTASECVYRLLDFDVKSFLLAPVLKWIIIQELEPLNPGGLKLHAKILYCSDYIKSVVSSSASYEQLHRVLDLKEYEV